MPAHRRNEPADRPERHARPDRDRRRRLPDLPQDFWARSDIRRRHARERADDLLASAHVLPAHDAALLRAVIVDNIPMKDLAALKHTCPRTIRRTVHALIRRLRSPEFGFVVRHAHAWTDERRLVARAVFLHGHSLRRATEDLNLSLHAVRGHVDSVTAMCESARHLATELAAANLAAHRSQDPTDPPAAGAPDA